MRMPSRPMALLLLLLLVTGCTPSDRSARRVTIPGVTESLNPGAPASEPAVTVPGPRGEAGGPNGPGEGTPAQSPTPPSAPPVAASQLLRGVRLELRLPEPPPGEAYTLPLDVMVVVENQRAEPVRWRSSSSCPDPTLVKAITPDGATERLSLIGGPENCTEDLSPQELPPGRHWIAHYRWAPQDDSTHGPVQIVASYPVGLDATDPERVEVSLDLLLP